MHQLEHKLRVARAFIGVQTVTQAITVYALHQLWADYKRAVKKHNELAQFVNLVKDHIDDSDPEFRRRYQEYETFLSMMDTNNML